MAKVVICADGSVVRGEDDDQLVSRMEDYLRDTHPRLAGQLSREEILSLARSEEADDREAKVED